MVLNEASEVVVTMGGRFLLRAAVLAIAELGVGSMSDEPFGCVGLSAECCYMKGGVAVPAYRVYVKADFEAFGG